MATNYSLQDFSLINSIVKRKMDDYKFTDYSNGFYFLALDVLYNLQDDEIQDSITDNFFLRSQKKESGHDRGIDAIYIDDSNERANVHIFNFKYSNSFEGTQKNFPSGEIDKIVGYLNLVMQQDIEQLKYVNPVLKSKTEEIWELFKSQNPQFTIHLCSNLYYGLERQEKKRFELELSRYAAFSLVEHTIVDWVNLITKRGKKKLHAQVRAIDKNYFEKSFGDIRALIVNIDAKDLIRIIIDNDEYREQADFEDYEQLLNFDILEDAFENNVRVYLKQRTKINRNIKETALSDENFRFFYYNNGITITCDKFTYIARRAPIIEMENLQVVNGSQTLHALFDAFKEDPECLENIDLLVRIYETENDELTTRIAEYTNSQNPVNNRDIRAIDYNQIKLENELVAKGFYYERKKNQHSNRAKSQRIDSEKAGQVLMAFYNELPGEAKNKKSIIFSEKYEDVFNDDINATKLLLPYKLYEKIEAQKNSWKEMYAQQPNDYSSKLYLSYSTYYILYLFKKVAELIEVPVTEDSVDILWEYYDFNLSILEEIIQTEQKLQGTNFQLMSLFKYGKPKKHIEDMIETGQFKSKLEHYQKN